MAHGAFMVVAIDFDSDELLQTALDQIEVRVQLRGELPEGAEARCTEAILSDMPGPYTVSYRYEERIELDPGGKFEDFICQVAP